MALCGKLLAIFHVRILTLGLKGKPNDLNLLVYYWTNKRTVDMFGRKIRLKISSGNCKGESSGVCSLDFLGIGNHPLSTLFCTGYFLGDVAFCRATCP
jgi:hypothetical protein